MEMFNWRHIILVLLLPYSLWLIFNYQFHFIDYVNLAFHEAGHLFLTPFGTTMHFLGGSVGQLVFPILVSVKFLREDKKFEAGIGGIWFAESMMNIAWYMTDANVRIIPLVGGGVHDWYFLFGQWGILRHAEKIGGFVHILACLLLGASLYYMYLNAAERRST